MGGEEEKLVGVSEPAYFRVVWTQRGGMKEDTVKNIQGGNG